MQKKEKEEDARKIWKFDKKCFIFVTNSIKWYLL